MTPRIRILHLYDRYLNIYADRGNIAVLRQRCTWRGIECEIRGLSPGESFEPADVDLIYVGGGQDRDQAMIAERMSSELREPLHGSLDEQTPMLAVCGGYQLLGHWYVDTAGREQPGVGIFDLTTRAGQTRMIGNVAIECDLPAIAPMPALPKLLVAGFENHAGRTELGPHATPLGRVVHGYGNDGSSGYEGCIRNAAVGTYLHGPLLPRNPQLADWLIAAALRHAGNDVPGELQPLDADVIAAGARDVARARAASERRIRA